MEVSRESSTYKPSALCWRFSKNCLRHLKHVPSGIVKRYFYYMLLQMFGKCNLQFLSRILYWIPETLFLLIEHCIFQVKKMMLPLGQGCFILVTRLIPLWNAWKQNIFIQEGPLFGRKQTKLWISSGSLRNGFENWHAALINWNCLKVTYKNMVMAKMIFCSSRRSTST